MYSLQKPDFEVLILAELQRQQQSQQFCDVLLKAKDTFVPMHSCILSALSPSIYSTLSSMPPPPPGNRWLLDFPTLDNRTMFHLVRLFYTGRMTGVAENEKQETICAAARLGIHGLVEETETDNGGQAELCRHKEAGVQTDAQRREEDERPQVRWRREVVEGNTYLWKEMLSGPGKEVWTQTEETSAAPLALPLASFETVDVEAFQNLTQADYHQCVPVAVLCPPKDNQTHQLSSSTPPASDKEPSHSAEPVPARNDPPTHFPHQRVCGTAMPQSSWTGLQGANRIATEPDELENEDFEHFQDNIPGFINYFMNQDKKEERGLRGRGRGRQRGASTAGAGQQRARRPRGEPQVEPKGGPRGRPRGGPRGKPRISGLVDGENVKTSKPKKMLLQKWGVKTPRTGQGGGSVGKKLFLKTRDDLKATRRQRGCSQAWKQSPIKNVQPRTLGREQKRPHQRRCNQESFRENKSSLVSVQPSSSFTGPLQTSSAHISAPPAASHITAGPPTLHNTPLPPQEEQIDRLLDEVLMELHILPNNYSIPAQTQGPLPTSSSTFGSSQARSKQQDPPAGSEVPVLQQQSEGELNEILVNFLQSFEEHIESREACDASRASDDGQPYTIQSEQTKSSSDPQGPSRVRCFQAAINGDLREAPAAGETCSEGIKKTLKKKKPKELTSRKIKTLPLEKKVKKRRKEKSSSDAKAKSVIERADYLQHQQRTTGKKSATSREQSCQSLENEAKNGFDHDLVSIGLKVYPIRSRISRSFSKELTRAEEAPPAEKVHKSRPRKRAQALILSNGEHKVEPVQLDSQSYSDNQAEKHREGDFTMLPREEPTARGRKRGSEETSHASTVTKRPCFDQTTQSGREAFSPASGSEDLSSTEQDEVIDVETVSLRSESDYHLDTKLKQEEERRQVISKESSDDEVIDVEVD